jgi:tRNA(Ile)-lysidine synthase
MFCIDKNNADTDISRNLIRNKIIPELEKLNTSLITTFTQNISIFSNIYKIYNEFLQKNIKEILITKDDTYYIDINRLLKHPDTSLLLFEILHPLGYSGSQSRQIEQSMVRQSGKIFYSATHSLVKDRQYLIIQERKNITTKQAQANDIQVIHSLEELIALGFQVEIMNAPADIQFERDNRVLYMDADTIHFPLILRHWKSGDYFYPFGMKQRKKLSDFFNDIKLNLIEKKEVKLLCCGDDIVWIVGYRADNRFRVTEDTLSVCFLTYQ